MCWKKKITEPLQPAEKRALIFGINDYPGTYNDLAGCVNDAKDIKAWLEKYGYTCNMYLDSEVTKVNFKTKLAEAVAVLRAGDRLFVTYSGHGTYVSDKTGDEGNGYDEALYVYDGVVVDDEINSILKAIPEGAQVTCIFDSCFSATVTRMCYQGRPKRNRFHRVSSKVIRKKLKGKIGKGVVDSNWVTLSACGENQTAADAYFNNRPNGAFTYFLLRAYKDGMTYNDWFTKIRQYLPSQSFSQIPEIECRFEFLNKLVLT